MSFEKDFSKRRHFPGVAGNPFDIFLHKLEILERIPNFLFAVVLLLIASLIAWGNWSYGIALWAFFLADWVMLAILPRSGRSFGPPKPPVLLMALARSVIALLPVPFNLILEGCGTLLVIYGYYIEPFKIKVNHEKLKTDKLSSSINLRILHLGDLHIERITKRELNLVNYINRLKPDIILFSGDILNLSYINDQKSWEDARDIIKQWKADLGVYFVSGSPAVDTSEVFPEVVKGLPIFWLQDRKITVNLKIDEAIDIYGISCTHRPHIDKMVLSNIFENKNDNFSILLYHSPDLSPEAANLGMDLQLSGHTHGGQICLPLFGAIITGSLYGKRFESGKMHIGDMTLNITRGIGMEGGGAPRARFFCPPEIHLIELSGR